MTAARAYVGLGANVGDAPRTLEAAVNALGALPGASLAGVSRLYLTRPVGVTDQPDFHDAVVALDVPERPDPSAAAVALLIALKRIERAFGRRRRERWGPREIDLDLLLFGDHRISVARPPEAWSARALQERASERGPQWLEVPHPAAHERLFVLAPLGDLAPQLRPRGWGESVSEARDRRVLEEGPEAVRAVAEWDAVARRWREASSSPRGAPDQRGGRGSLGSAGGRTGVVAS